MNYVESNKTRYSSVDINAICAWIEEEVKKLFKQELNTLAAEFPEASLIPASLEPLGFVPLIGVRYKGKQEPCFVRTSLGRRSMLLYIRPLPAILKELPELEVLGCVDKTTLPDRVVNEICSELAWRISSDMRLYNRLREWWQERKLRPLSDWFGPVQARILTQLCARVEEQNFAIRVLKGVVDRPIKKSTAEKRHALRKSYINEGYRKYGGERLVLRGSTRTPDVLWKARLAKAEVYYVREWGRLDKYRVKLQALGEEVEQSHETWADYLRRLANDWERRQK